MNEPAASRVDALLDDARSYLLRVSPVEARERQLAGRSFLVDTRTPEQRAAQGEIPGALVIDRTVLEWRLDPTCKHSIDEAATASQWIVLCRQGFSSSLAARSLQLLGVDATDVIGGVEAWLAEGLPTHGGRVDQRR